MKIIHIAVPNTSERDALRYRTEAYLYNNFTITDETEDTFIIQGEDVAGFTAEAQAMRLQTGLIAAQVVN